MIYFSVNSDKHFLFFSRVIDEFGIPRDKIRFIVQENPRNNRVMSSSYQRVTLPGHPFGGGKGKFNPGNLTHLRLVRKSLSFSKDDVLMIPTEYELNNHIYASMMKSAGGRVYFFDEGIGTYFDNSPFHRRMNKKPLVLLKRLFAYVFFQVIGLKGSNAVKAQEGYYFRIDDKRIDMFYSSHKLSVDRSFKMTEYRHFNASKRIDMDRDAFMFCTSDFACYGLREEEKELAVKTLKHAKKRFCKVYVKIHPAEYAKNSELLAFYKKFCQDNDLAIVGNDESFEESILKRRPWAVAASMSTSLFDAALLGCEPVFTYHLLPKIKSFGVYDFTMKSLAYNYIKSLEDISPEYKSNITDFTYDKPLAEVLEIKK